MISLGCLCWCWQQTLITISALAFIVYFEVDCHVHPLSRSDFYQIMQVTLFVELVKKLLNFRDSKQQCHYVYGITQLVTKLCKTCMFFFFLGGSNGHFPPSSVQERFSFNSLHPLCLFSGTVLMEPAAFTAETFMSVHQNTEPLPLKFVLTQAFFVVSRACQTCQAQARKRKKKYIVSSHLDSFPPDICHSAEMINSCLIKRGCGITGWQHINH